MTVRFRTSFARDLKAIKDRAVLRRVQQVIAEVEEATAVQEISGLTKLSGSQQFYRIRLGDYRIGLSLEGGTIEFVRCLHRRDIYRYFP